MFDAAVRGTARPALETLARAARRRGATPGTITAAGLAAGIAASVAAGFGAWWAALAALLVNRVLDGLDGALARMTGQESDLGGLLDFLADFVLYGGFVVGTAVAVPDARVACVVLLATYLLNNVALLSFASLIERRGLRFGDERSLRFTPGLAEGTETVAAYVAICLLPGHAGTIAWVFVGVVTVTVLQRVALAVRVLR